MYHQNKEASVRWRGSNSLDQDLPPTKEWNEFLMNHKNKLQIVNLLADHIKSGRINKKGSKCFLVTEDGSNWARIPELDSTQGG